DRWLQRWPEIPCVLTHGFAPDLLEGTIPDPVMRLLSREQLMIELLYPIHRGRLHDYRWPELRSVIERQIELAGSSRLVWGSDMPYRLPSCAYRRTLEYLPQILDGAVAADDLELILGGIIPLICGIADR